MKPSKCTLMLLIVLAAIAAGAGSGAAALELGALPRNPEQACNSSTTVAALTRCGISGATPACCTGLDEVFAAPASPAVGCLCFPQVLYRVVQTAAARRVDILRTLQACKTQQGSLTAWAMDTSSNASCPAVFFADNPATIAARLGDVPVFPGTPTWGWGNILQAGHLMLQHPDWMSGVLTKEIGFFCVQLMFTMLLCIAPIFLVLHKLVLMRWSRVYRALSPMQQLVTCQHAVYALVLGLQLVPQSYLTLRVLFRAWSGEYMVGPEPPILIGSFLMTHAALYVLEASVRSINFNWLLLLHHQLFFAITVICLWTSNLAGVVLGLILDWFVSHEAPLYVVLLAYRLKWPRRLSLGLMWVAWVWYIITRLLQSLLLLYPIVMWASNPAVRFTPAFIFVSALCAALTLVQAYTLVIYRGIWRRLAAPGADSSQTLGVEKVTTVVDQPVVVAQAVPAGTNNWYKELRSAGINC